MKWNMNRFFLAGLFGVGMTYALVQAVGTQPTGNLAYAQQAAESQEARGKIYAQADQLSTAFREVAKSLKPSVVSIQARVERRVVQRGGGNGIPPIFQDFLGEDFGFEMPEREGGEAEGSGFIVTSDGYVLTNNHVVQGATNIDVILSDNRRLDAKVVGTDPDSDIAVLKVEATGLVAAPLGDSDAMQVGDWVVAIGSPFGLTQTVTSGIVSAVNRDRVANGNITKYDNFIQTDAAINPGNSGGPLLNLQGQVIGINTAIATRSGTSAGVGFAIPSNMAKDALEDIVKTGRVVRGFIGASLRDLDDELAEQLGVEKNAQGVVIEVVSEDGPADKAGLKPGDVVTSLNGQAVQNLSQLRLKVASMSPGEIAKFDVLRNGKSLKLNVKIEEQTKEKMNAMAGGRILEQLGIEVESLTTEDARDLGLDSAEVGVLVTRVDRRSPMARVLRTGEAILAIDRTPVSTVAELVAAIGESLERGRMALTIRNPQATRMVQIQL